MFVGKFKNIFKLMSSTNFFPKKLFKNVQLTFILSFLINLVNSDSGNYTEESMKSNIIPGLGLGYGTFFVIFAIVIGILLMIFGLAFTSPGLFVFIGIAIPAIVFIFVICCPSYDDTKETKNGLKRNNYIVARWFHFLVMLILFFGLLAPAFSKWNINIIPQRVDSSSQKDFYDEKYMEAIEKQKKRKYNMEETDISLPQRLPLGINRKRNNFTRTIPNSQSNSLIQNNSQNNISNNLIDNTNIENSNSNELPKPILPSTTKRNEFNENRKKFTGFVRKKDK